MPSDERELLIEILQRVTAVETKVDTMTNTKDIAVEALQSTKAAHKRLDELSKQIEDDKKNGKDDKKWLIGTAIGVIALVWNFIKGGVGQ